MGGTVKRGSGHAAYPSRLLIRLSKAMLTRVKREAAIKGQSASTYVRLALVDALQRDKPAEPRNADPSDLLSANTR